MNDELAIDESERERQIYEQRFFQSQINTAVPCKVLEVLNNRVTIQLNILRQFKDVAQDALTLYDVPVVFPGSGSSTVRFPIAAGDTGLVIFAQRDIDNWLEGETATPDTTRMHDMADGIVIPGLRVFSDSTIPEELEITSGNLSITILKSGQVKIENAQFDLVKLLTDLATQLSTATAPSSGGPLSSNAAVALLAAQLSTFNGT